MGYEYKEEIENYIICAPVYVYDEVFDELDEVYAKAKAFDKIRNVDKDFYKEYGYYPNEEEWWYDASNTIEKYEEVMEDK